MPSEERKVSRSCSGSTPGTTSFICGSSPASGRPPDDFKSATTLAKAEKLALRDAGMKFPGSDRGSPLGSPGPEGEGKGFHLFIALEGDELSMSVKLPQPRTA